MTHPSPPVITLNGLWELAPHPAHHLPLTPHSHPSPHRLTQHLLNIAPQKVLLDCVRLFVHTFILHRMSVDVCFQERLLCMYECLCMHENASLWAHQVISYVSSLNLRQGEKCVGPLSDPEPCCSERYCFPYCCWKAPSVPGVLIYVPEPLHLQLLSIRLYNIPPIVQLPALSALPRPVSKTCPTHNHTRSSKRRGEGGADRTEREIEEVGYNR